MKRTRILALALASVALASGLRATVQIPARGIKIVMVAKSEANLIFLAARKGAEAAAQELSQKYSVPIELAWRTPPQEDPVAQAEQIARAAHDGASAILVSCSDTATLTPAIDAAVKKGVPVMTFDSDAPESKRFAFYGTDDADLGDRIMTDLAELLGHKGKIAILAGSASAPNLIKRAEAVRRAAARYPGVEVVETVHHRETPQDAAAAVIRINAAHPDLAGWAMVGGWPLFRSSATPDFVANLQQRGLKVVATGTLPDQFMYVERGLVPVLWAQPVYLWGKVGVETIVDKLLVRKSVPEKIHMELVRVSRANLGTWARQLKRWGFSGIPDEYLKLQ